MGKTAIYLGFFCIYSVILLIMGKGSFGGNSTPEEYFICERKVGLRECVCTFTGTWISAITILSLTGSVYEEGISPLLYSVVPWFLGAFFLALVTKYLYRSKAITVPEMIRLNFGSGTLQAAAGFSLIIVYINYLVTQYKGFGMVASEMFDIPYPAAVGMVYLFIMYTTIGGYRSVLRTDMFNLILLTVSLSVVCFSCVSQCGGFREMYGKAAMVSGMAHPGMQIPTGPGQMMRFFQGRFTPLTCFSMFWGWGLGLAANPQYIVRLLSAKDSRTAQRTVLISIGILIYVYFLLVNTGLAMRVLVPVIPERLTTDGIFIRLINHELYGPWSGFFFLSVIGACISTANSQLLMVASAVSYDIYGNLGRRRTTPRKVVMLGRLTVVAGGTLAMLLTLNPPEFILSFGGDLWGIVAILLFPPLYASVLFPGRITFGGVRAALITGSIMIMLLYPLYYTDHLKFHPAMLGVPAAGAALFLFSARERRAL